MQEKIFNGEKTLIRTIIPREKVYNKLNQLSAEKGFSIKEKPII